MWRLLLVLMLPLCLLIKDQCGSGDLSSDESGATAIEFKREVPVGPAHPAQDFVASLGISPTCFPASLPWYAIRQVGLRREQAIENIVRENPVEFLQMCLDRYDREVQSYSCILVKTERVNGKTEKVEACFREEPFSVYMNWLHNAGKAQRLLYVAGENDGKMLVRPAGLLGFVVVGRDVNDPDVKRSGRYLVTEFGIKLGTERTLKAMRAAQKAGTLHVKYEGIFRVPETGDRLCYKIVRTPYTPPEDEGVYDLTVYIDLENWLQIGSLLRDSEGKLIADYFFRDVHINPKFKDNQFTRGAM